jgi:hypothetical protein
MESYKVSLIERATGREHNVVGAGSQPILDETTGEPETEFALVAEVGGHYVNLGTFDKGYVDHMVGRPDTRIPSKSKSSSSSSSSASSAKAPPNTPQNG